MMSKLLKKAYIKHISYRKWKQFYQIKKTQLDLIKEAVMKQDKTTIQLMMFKFHQSHSPLDIKLTKMKILNLCKEILKVFKTMEAQYLLEIY
jgi:cytidylate kinase